MHHPNDTPATAHRAPQNTVALGVGFGIGIIWIILAGMALWSAARGFTNSRNDWGIAFALVGVLLLAAGLAAMIGTWWHQTRVVGRGH